MNEVAPLTYGRDGRKRRWPSSRTVVIATVVLVGAAALLLVALVAVNEVDRRRVERRVKGELQAAIPIGTPAWQAQASLDQIRPHVERRSQASFGDRKNLDYLYLMWNDGGRYLHTMETAVVLMDGAVSEILVRSDSGTLGR